MMRLVITFFLSFSFLFIRGLDHLHAHVHHTRVCYSPAQLPEISKQSGSSANEKGNQSIRKNTSSGTQNEIIDATEIEDEDDVQSFRKYIEISNYFIAFFYAQVLGDLHRYQKDRLPICKHFSYTSSFKYIIQRSIRV